MTNPFSNDILDLGINYGTVTSLISKTSIIENGSGAEQRNIDWYYPLLRFQIGNKILNKSELDYLLSFHSARKGSYEGFLFKDWSDYKVLSSTVSNGQLCKVYEISGYSVLRAISHPVPNSIPVRFNVPVRFEQDEIRYRFLAIDTNSGEKLYELEQLSLLEIRWLTNAAPEALPGSGELNHTIALGYDLDTLTTNKFATQKTQLFSGHEHRLNKWDTPQLTFDIGARTLDLAELEYLISLFRISRGPGIPFRYNDWGSVIARRVRFGEDSISFRFDAIDLSSGQSIYYLSGTPLKTVKARQLLDNETYFRFIIDTTPSMPSTTISNIVSSLNLLKEELQSIYEDNIDKYIKPIVYYDTERYLLKLSEEFRDSQSEAKKIVNIVFQNEAEDGATGYHSFPRENNEPTATFTADLAVFKSFYAPEIYTLIVVPTSSPPQIYEAAFNGHIIDAINSYPDRLISYGIDSRDNFPIDATPQEYLSLIQGYLSL